MNSLRNLRVSPCLYGENTPQRAQDTITEAPRKSPQRTLVRVTLFSLLILITANPSSAQNQTKRNDRPKDSTASPEPRDESHKTVDPTKYTYEFSQPKFVVRHVVIEHDAVGHGKLTFERQSEDAPIIEPLEISTGALGRIFGLWKALHFLDSSENYQAAKQFPHLGTYRIGMDDGQRKRTAEFNWSGNRDAWALITEYRRLADQILLIFDLKLARELQPLNTPQLLNQLDTLFTRGELSDPQQLVPLLTDLRTDEHIPLIARNHADRLLKKIEK